MSYGNSLNKTNWLVCCVNNIFMLCKSIYVYSRYVVGVLLFFQISSNAISLFAKHNTIFRAEDIMKSIWNRRTKISFWIAPTGVVNCRISHIILSCFFDSLNFIYNFDWEWNGMKWMFFLESFVYKTMRSNSVSNSSKEHQ